MEGALTSGKKWASGTATVTVDTSSNSSSRSWIQVDGLDFKPNIVILTAGSSPLSYCARNAVSIRSGHSLLSYKSLFTSGQDYTMCGAPNYWQSSNANTGTMGTYNYYQMGTNSFRIPISFQCGYGANMKYNWYATE